MATRKPLIVNPTVSQIQELPTGDSLDGIANITATGEITAVQPTCLLTVPVQYTAKGYGASPASDNTNGKPISFTNITTNVGCTTSLAPDATVTTTGISSITVPSAGTYLVSAMISGAKIDGAGSDDQVRLGLTKSGVGTFPNLRTFPTFVFGGTDTEEFNCTFTLPLTLSASDTLSVDLSHVDTSSAAITEGYFSVVKLH
tara:strand:+ start:40 stop:642 length:603 start_codon:yes stop_codon:yes gene_type:complete